MSDRLVLVTTSSRLPPGLLSWPAWAALREAPRVLAGQADHPAIPALAQADIPVEVIEADPAAVWAAVRAGGLVAWLAAPDGDERLVRGLGALVARESLAGTPVELEVVYGSYDPAGARLLDLVAVMDRLRSAGGCPWDAEQTHASLVRYLLEEAYELVETIESGDLAALREELGDVLLQVVFHARIAEEAPVEDAFTIDDVAAGITAKLVRRHPHVFAGGEAATAADVQANWDVLKAAEKGRVSVTDGVPLAQPALSLAAKLVSRARRHGLSDELLPTGTALGERLFTLAAEAEAAGVDPEAALRAAARAYRDRVVAAEQRPRRGGPAPDPPAGNVTPDWQPVPKE